MESSTDNLWIAFVRLIALGFIPAVGLGICGAVIAVWAMTGCQP